MASPSQPWTGSRGQCPVASRNRLQVAVPRAAARVDSLKVKEVAKQVDSLALTVWIKVEGRWQVVTVHSTPYPK